MWEIHQKFHPREKKNKNPPKNSGKNTNWPAFLYLWFLGCQHHVFLYHWSYCWLLKMDGFLRDLGVRLLSKVWVLALRSWNPTMNWSKKHGPLSTWWFFTNPPLIGVSYPNFKAIFWCHITPFATITRWWFFTKPFEKYDGLVNLDHLNPQGWGWKFKKCLKPTTYSSSCWTTFPKKKRPSFLSSLWYIIPG